MFNERYSAKAIGKHTVRLVRENVVDQLHANKNKKSAPRYVQRYYFSAHRRRPNRVVHTFAQHGRLCADVLALPGLGLARGSEDIRQVRELDGEHRVRGRKEREHAQVVAGAVVRADHTYVTKS